MSKKKRIAVEQEMMDALDQSIEDYKDMVRDPQLLEGHECPLCELCFGDDGGCSGCVVYRDTGQRGCGGTPFDDIRDLEEDELTHTMIAEELDYLIDLRKRCYVEEKLPEGVCQIIDLKPGDIYVYCDGNGMTYKREPDRYMVVKDSHNVQPTTSFDKSRGDKLTMRLDCTYRLGFAIGTTRVKKIAALRLS